jgi:flagellar motor switch/type III secretory pathway protein FliN
MGPEDVCVRVRGIWFACPDGVAERIARSASYLLQSAREREIGIAVDAGLARLLIGRILGTPPSSGSSPTAAEAGIVAYAIATLIAQVGALSGWALLDRVPQLPAFVEEAYVIEVELGLGPDRGIAWLLVSREVLVTLEPTAAAAHRALDRLEGVEIEVVGEVAGTLLPLQQAQGLGSGDCLVFDGCPRPGALESAWLRVGGGGFRARVEAPGRLRLASDYEHGGSVMGSAQSRVNEQVEVPVVIEMGRVEISAAELLELGPGDVVSLRRPLTAALDVRAGGKLIGRGELVDIGGEAGVRLVEVFG